MSVRLFAGRGGLKTLRIECDYGSAEIVLQGAHVTSWRPAGGPEMLFVSAAAVHAPGASIRGGVPIAFPQFAELGPLPMHGFAHTVPWEWSGAAYTGVRLALHDDEHLRGLWPHAFAAEVVVDLGPGSLTVGFAVRNTGDRPLAWAGTLHTFVALQAGAAVIRGLGPGRYVDRARDSRPTDDPDTELRIPGHTDRAYLDAGPAVEVDDGERCLVIQKTGFRDTVVWNPGPETSARFPDLTPDDHRSFVCIEAAEVRPVTVAPGAAWSGRQTLSLA